MSAGTPGTPAELVVLGGAVLTMDPAAPTAEAVAISNGSIVFVGSDAEARRQVVGPRTEVVDAAGRTVVPGFADAHAHWGLAAVTLAHAVPVGTPPISSIDELVAEGRRALERPRASGWLLLQGSNFQDRYIAERALPDRRVLDRISTSVPVLYRNALHTLVLNTRALEVSGIGPDTPIPAGARVETDDHGEPTGVVHEMFGHLPIPDPTPAEIRASVESVARTHLVANGVTSIHEIWDSADVLRIQRELIAERRAPVRMSAYGWVPLVGPPATAACGAGLEPIPGWFELAGVKLFADGGTSARTAAMIEPYCDSHDHGALVYDDGALDELLERCKELGSQILVHTAGDAAYWQVLRAFERVGIGPRPGAPHRFEHAANHSWSDDLGAECRRLGVLPVPNVGFIFNYGEFWPDILGEQRTHDMVPLRTLFDAGFAVPGTSDTTGGALASFNPLHNIARAVTRLSILERPVSAHQAITVEEGLRMYTAHGAAAAGHQADRGRLAEGMVGDLVVLSTDVSRLAPSELIDAAVDYTVAGGQVVHERG